MKAIELAKMGPTSANQSPMRVLFLRSQAAKERLRPALSPGNLDKTMGAPVVAITAYRREVLRASAVPVSARRRQALVLQATR